MIFYSVSIAASDPDAPRPTPRAITDRLATIRKIAKGRDGIAVQFSAPSTGTSPAAASKSRLDLASPVVSELPVLGRTAIGRTVQGSKSSALSTPQSASRTTNKPRTPSKRPLALSNEEDFETDSDADSLDSVAERLKTPSKAKSSQKIKLRPTRRPRYTLEPWEDDEELPLVDSDDGDFSPHAERKEVEQKARRRKGAWSNADDEM